jgi:hypothetical protein
MDDLRADVRLQRRGDYRAPGVVRGLTMRRGRGLTRRCRRELFRVFAAGLLGVHAFRAALLMLQAGDARPAALLIVAHRDVQGAAALAGELDLVAVHERIEPAMVGAGGQDVARQ